MCSCGQVITSTTDKEWQSIMVLSLDKHFSIADRAGFSMSCSHYHLITPSCKGKLKKKKKNTTNKLQNPAQTVLGAGAPSFFLPLCYQTIQHLVLQKLEILIRSQASFRTGHKLEHTNDYEVNRNVKLIFRPEGEALGTECEAVEQRKAHALPTTRLVSLGFSYSCWRDSGNSRGGPLKLFRALTLNCSSVFWDTWTELSCQRDHIFS